MVVSNERMSSTRSLTMPLSMAVLNTLPGAESRVSVPVPPDDGVTEEQAREMESEAFHRCNGGPPSSVTPIETQEELEEAVRVMKRALRDFSRGSNGYCG